MNGNHEPVVLVVLADDATQKRVAGILAACDLPPRPGPRWRRHGARLVTLRLAAARGDLVADLQARPGVARVFLLPAGTPLFAAWPLEGAGRVPLGARAAFGDPAPVIVAGPCSVENEAQLLATAECVAAAGAAGLRGGAFKPRSSPYDFGGLGADGLALLARARARTGLPFVTEALDPTQLDAVAATADMIQIGARNMHDTELLFRAGAHPAAKPILLKRGFGATVEEFLYAAEYVLLGRIAGGHAEPGLVLCERGIRTFETGTRFTLDVAAIPALQQRTHLPVIADPSHAPGARALVAPCARAALAAGACGLLVEVHPDPDRAWCDGAHSLDPRGFAELMAAIGVGTGATRD
ncbi:MAG: 3-deoxy-7-phosphoheptulonate synthase [Planctomycetes bacterium]|nr:3-deoxy-7-phosphoheptulonate synthase [Planctomycetota bacterium]